MWPMPWGRSPSILHPWGSSWLRAMDWCLTAGWGNKRWQDVTTDILWLCKHDASILETLDTSAMQKKRDQRTEFKWLPGLPGVCDLSNAGPKTTWCIWGLAQTPHDLLVIHHPFMESNHQPRWHCLPACHRPRMSSGDFKCSTQEKALNEERTPFFYRATRMILRRFCDLTYCRCHLVVWFG